MTLSRPSPESARAEEDAAPGLQPETRGRNFYLADGALQGLLPLYLAPEELSVLEPHLVRLGAAVGGRLDELAAAANENPPQLVHRDRQGRDRQRIETDPAYREMEHLAFGELALAAASHRPALGHTRPLHPASKYALTYLFAQSEFGLLCPVNMTDSLTRTLRLHAAPALLERYLPGLLCEDPERVAQGAMFMTEQAAGSDVGAITTRAVPDGAAWRLHGEKWFCSNADADLALVLARPEGAPAGTRGLGLFLMPRLLDGGEPNRYRIVRLKDKLGSRSMASGEIVLEGALAYLVGKPGAGFAQMTEMINQSRLSNAVRAAGMMRRACHEALTVARGRRAFGRRLIDMPLMRRQLVKLLAPTEAALSVVLFAADALARTDAGDERARRVRRVLTPLAKFRACRDARRVTGDAMEVRGGCGYVEDWIEPRLVRDAHLGSIWEGASNVIALDVLRAARKEDAHEALGAALAEKLDAIDVLPEPLRAELHDRLADAVSFVGTAARETGGEWLARQGASALYYACAACLMAWEGATIGAGGGDARRLLWAGVTAMHELSTRDPLATGERAREAAVADALLGEAPVTLERAAALLAP